MSEIKVRRIRTAATGAAADQTQALATGFMAFCPSLRCGLLLAPGFMNQALNRAMAGAATNDASIVPPGQRVQATWIGARQRRAAPSPGGRGWARQEVPEGIERADGAML
ncbi:MAG: hypothetical protein ACYC0T_09845 [Ramlibacter sp.]